MKDGTGLPPSTTIPVRYETCAGAESDMTEATFQGVNECESLACGVGGRIEVDTKVGGGWVFCGVDMGDWGGYGTGQYLHVTGGTFELLESPNSAVWSGDESIGRFAVTHDGFSSEIVVVYGTRAD
jgi:hypothetical protein